MKFALDRFEYLLYDPAMRNGLFFLIISLLMLSMLCGCVRRRMTVRSNPTGATVYLDGQEIGRTPFSTNFDFYGKREFRVVKQGYETKTVTLPVAAPWYEWVGFDFVSEVLLPGKLTDQKFYEFDLQPEKLVPGAEIVARAEDFRQTAHANGIPRMGNVAVPFPTASVPTAAGEAGSISYPAPSFMPSTAPFVPPVMSGE
jgi:hypothetical protein